MGDLRELTPDQLGTILQRARQDRAPLSLRALGCFRIQGDLHLTGLEVGKALQLSGARRRDHLHPQGTPVMLTVLLGDEVYSLRTTMLAPILSPEGDTQVPPILRLAWPVGGAECHQRASVRVAGPDLPALEATLILDEARIPATVMNLTETGMGLSVEGPIPVRIRQQVEIDVMLPGERRLRATAEVRFVEAPGDGAAMTHIGMVLGCMTPDGREGLRAFIQARRTDLSEGLRASV